MTQKQTYASSKSRGFEPGDSSSVCEVTVYKGEKLLNESQSELDEVHGANSEAI